MEMDVLQGLENFDQVWMRVRGEPAPAARASGSVPEAAGDEVSTLLCQRMDVKCAQAKFYAAAAKQSSPAVGHVLLCLAEEERRHLRSLQLEYFLRTGRCHRPVPACSRRDSPLQNLRMAWLGEREAAAQFRKDAQSCPTDMRETLLHIAAEDEAHAARLRALLKSAIVG